MPAPAPKKTLKVGDEVYIRAQVIEIFPVNGQLNVRLGVYNMNKVQPINSDKYSPISVQGAYAPIIVVFDDGNIMEISLPV